MRASLLASALFAVSVSHAAAQGVDAPTTVNLGGGSSWRGVVPTGPVPRLPDGTVSLEGVWQGGGPVQRLEQGLAKGETIPMLPWAKAKMAAMKPTDSTEANCLPATTPRVPSAYPWRMVQYPTHSKATHIFMLFEANIHSFRQIFMDGRKHPPAEEMDPTWYGHSIGWWEGDTLVIDTIGYNDKFWMDSRGTPHTEQMHTIERWTRVNFGTLELALTIIDPGTFSRPVNLKFTAKALPPGEELMELICTENNQYGIADGIKNPLAQ